ncbi:MAG: CBS domain-containing protein [Nitrososphaerota archaeon]
MLARDIMTRQIISTSPATEIQAVADLLTDYRISGVPVVDEEGEMVGLVTEADLIGKQGATAADIMTTRVTTVQENAPVDEVAQILTSKHFKRVPVMRDDRLVGIVSRADIVRMMASRWACAICGAIQHGHRPTDCLTCGADGSYFEREIDPRPEVSQHQ